MTNGLALSRKYFEVIGKPKFQNAFPNLYPRMAFGLAGEGSDCFGFDDEFSRDHDWGPGFCIWLTQDDFKQHGRDVKAVYENMPKTFEGFTRIEMKEGANRVGVHAIDAWFMRYTGLDHIPQTNAEWARIPLSFLATATNGEIFFDPLGVFTKKQQDLRENYPEDLWLWQIAHCAAIMAQSGQYNLPRALKRGDNVTATLTLAKFLNAGLTMVYALNRIYPPYDKWLFRGSENLAKCARTHDLFQKLIHTDAAEQPELIERICLIIAGEIRRQQLSNCSTNFLLGHCPDILSHIADPAVQRRPIL